MAPNPLEMSVQIAEKTGEKLGKVFARAGNSEHPNGDIMKAYRNTIRALRGAENHDATREIMSGLEGQVEFYARRYLNEGLVIGLQSAQAQLGAYDRKAPDVLMDRDLLERGIEAIQAAVKTQASTAISLAAIGGDPSLIYGDDERHGAVRPKPILDAISLWIVTLSSLQWASVVQSTGTEFKKQAIAAIDERTTDCCLRVHGQVVGLNEKFHLTGTPRYADYLDWSPFHWWCRTSVALYLPEYDDGLTERMKATSAEELARIAAGTRTERHPANAIGG
jgi:hypothetical protein